MKRLRMDINVLSLLESSCVLPSAMGFASTLPFMLELGVLVPDCGCEPGLETVGVEYPDWGGGVEGRFPRIGMSG
jgi:hypothetical protein